MATIRELRQTASEMGIKGYSRMRKAELEAAIENASAPAPIQFVEADVQRIGNGGLGDAARFIIALNDSHGCKGPSRKFRKMLRKAGFWHHAAVNVAKVDEYDHVAKAA